jgi:hypothetical protein
MLSKTLNSILSEPALIPLYLFVLFMVGVLGWEILKLIIFVIRNSGGTKK